MQMNSKLTGFGSMSDVLLDVKNLTITFGGAEVVSSISFFVKRGEVVALVGESGCGKSSASLALTGLLASNSTMAAGGIIFNSRSGSVDLASMPAGKLRKFRGSGIAYIFQEPSVSLNPVMTVREQIAEVICLHKGNIENVNGEIIFLLEQVGIPDPANRMNAYPHELSGGMQQRVMIAMALAGDPELLVADEPTTALDVTVQAQILELLNNLRKRRNMSILLISHNLGVVSSLADRIAVMYAGKFAEIGNVRDVMDNPCHPYTRALLAAVPVLGKKCGKLQTIPGFVPSPAEYPSGCRFAQRCSEKMDLCEKQCPGLIEMERCHFCACHIAGEKK